MNKGKKFTVNSFRKKKQNREKIVMLTAYDAAIGALAEKCGVDALLVGDSLGNTILGYNNTIPVTMDQMLHHAAAVRRGAPDAFIIGDMPFMSYRANPDDALMNAARFLREAGTDAVKLEGGEDIAPLVSRMVLAGIPVMGHIGLMPQQVLTSGGYKIAGKTDADAERLIREARTLEAAGVFAIVLEGIPAAVSKKITENTGVATIGIGGGIHCDGQVQVVNDILGLFTSFVPKHAKQYVNLNAEIEKAFTGYVSEVRSEIFPAEENSF